MLKKVLAVVLAVGMALSLAACGAAESPEETVKRGLEAVKSADAQTVQQIFEEHPLGTASSGKNETPEEKQKIIFGSMTYKITKTETNGKKAVCTVNITNKDFKAALAEYMKDGISLAAGNAIKPEGQKLSDQQLQKKMDELLLEKLKAANKTVTNTVEINLVQNDGGTWMIQTDDALADALTGGMRSAARDLSGGGTRQ